MTSWHGIESRLPDVMWTYITVTVWSEVIDNERYLSFLNTESLYFIPCLTTHTYLRIQCIKLLAAIVGLWMFTGSFVQGHKRSIQASNYTRESYEREQRNVAVVLIWCSCNTYTLSNDMSNPKTACNETPSLCTVHFPTTLMKETTDLIRVSSHSIISLPMIYLLLLSTEIKIWLFCNTMVGYFKLWLLNIFLFICME